MAVVDVDISDLSTSVEPGRDSAHIKRRRCRRPEAYEWSIRVMALGKRKECTNNIGQPNDRNRKAITYS